MNENWPEIVETLIPYFETNSVEGDYQREIENCLKFLGWKKTNGTMVSQYTLPIGNSNSIRPDIVLWRKNEHDTQSPVLPIEIKRPSNIRNERQENIIRKTKCFDFWERNVLFPKTKRSFFRTPKHPLPCPFPLNFSLLIITKKFGNLAKNRYICIV